MEGSLFHILRSRSNKILSRMHSFLLSRRNIHFRVALAISPLLPRRVGEGARAHAHQVIMPRAGALAFSYPEHVAAVTRADAAERSSECFPIRLASLAFVPIVRPSDTAKCILPFEDRSNWRNRHSRLYPRSLAAFGESEFYCCPASESVSERAMASQWKKRGAKTDNGSLALKAANADSTSERKLVSAFRAT